MARQNFEGTAAYDDEDSQGIIKTRSTAEAVYVNGRELDQPGDGAQRGADDITVGAYDDQLVTSGVDTFTGDIAELSTESNSLHRNSHHHRHHNRHRSVELTSYSSTPYTRRGNYEVMCSDCV